MFLLPQAKVLLQDLYFLPLKLLEKRILELAKNREEIVTAKKEDETYIVGFESKDGKSCVATDKDGKKIELEIQR